MQRRCWHRRRHWKFGANWFNPLRANPVRVDDAQTLATAKRVGNKANATAVAATLAYFSCWPSTRITSFATQCSNDRSALTVTTGLSLWPQSDQIWLALNDLGYKFSQKVFAWLIGLFRKMTLLKQNCYCYVLKKFCISWSTIYSEFWPHTCTSVRIPVLHIKVKLNKQKVGIFSRIDGLKLFCHTVWPSLHQSLLSSYYLYSKWFDHNKFDNHFWALIVRNCPA